MKVLVNGVNSKVGGGKSILNNYLSLLKDKPDGNYYFITCPNESEYVKYVSSHLKILKVPTLLKYHIFFGLLYFIWIPFQMKKMKIDLVFNMGDIPIPIHNQIYLFDWPYAAYPNSVVWGKMEWRSLLVTKLKLYVFKKMIYYPKIVIAQSETMANHLKIIYLLNNIVIIPNAVSLDNLKNESTFRFNFPQNKIKLLYLTYYYIHKNIEIFIPLAKKIKSENLPFIIITTIDKKQHKNAHKFLNEIIHNGLEDIITNVGCVPMSHVPSLYKQCDGMLMPTLLESFSGTYVEAQYHQIPIFTSNMDFAIDVCQDGAFYFDPLNSESILNSIQFAFKNKNLLCETIEKATQRLYKLSTWSETFEMYQQFIKSFHKI